MEPFLAQIIMFGGNFAPRGWAYCNGQLLPISQNSALFSLLGTTYGGDGRTNFALPDLRGRVAVNSGGGSAGPGLSPRPLGSRSGAERVTMTTTQMPSHNHAVPSPSLLATANPANSSDPTGNALSMAPAYNNADAPTVALNAASVGATTTDNQGGNQSQDNMPPYLAVNFIIALQGTFPSRS